MAKSTIILVDDHSEFRNAIKVHFSVNKNYKIIGEAENGKEFLTIIDKKLSDIVLMDISMPIMDGYEATKIAKEKYGEKIKIIALTAFDEFNVLQEMIEAGMSGYINKSSIALYLDDAINTVLQGKLFFYKDLHKS